MFTKEPVPNEQVGGRQMNELKINGIYKHFKGDYYLVEGIAKYSETQEEMVL